MTALFKAQHLSPTEQLSLALAWNRCDIATKEIFTYGKMIIHATFYMMDIFFKKMKDYSEKNNIF